MPFEKAWIHLFSFPLAISNSLNWDFKPLYSVFYSFVLYLKFDFVSYFDGGRVLGSIEIICQLILILIVFAC